MTHCFFSLLFVLASFSLIAQETISISTDAWKHTAAEGEKNVLQEKDTIFAGTDIFQVSKIEVKVENKERGKPEQPLILEVIYDDFAKERVELLLEEDAQMQSFTRKLEHNDIRNVAVVRIYGHDEAVNVAINSLRMSKTGKLKNLNDADKSEVKYRPGPFEKYGVIRATYPMAKPPFFMGINSRKVEVEAYAIPEELGTEANSTLKVTCIDADKAWRKEFTFDVTETPGTYTIEIDEDLEAEYEGYFMIFMPTPESGDIAIRMVEVL